ncbi:MAG: hypothetical protein JWQ02_3291 [Capsulimonas sp.]|nr:hypothetical protein [Capsulimonas sp.]
MTTNSGDSEKLASQMPVVSEARSPTISEIYKEQYAHFRGMNDILYKIPPLFTAVIGGLWYFAMQNISADKPVARSIFLFTALICLVFVHVMARFREAFSAYISNLNKMDGDLKVTIKSGHWSTITSIQFLLWMAATFSVLGSIYSFYK